MVLGGWWGRKKPPVLPPTAQALSTPYTALIIEASSPLTFRRHERAMTFHRQILNEFISPIQVNIGAKENPYVEILTFHLENLIILETD